MASMDYHYNRLELILWNIYFHRLAYLSGAYFILLSLYFQETSDVLSTCFHIKFAFHFEIMRFRVYLFENVGMTWTDRICHHHWNIVYYSDLVIHQHWSRDRLDFAVPGIIVRRGDAVYNNARRSVLDSLVVAARTCTRGRRRFPLPGVHWQQDSCSLNRSAVGYWVDLRNLRQFCHAVVRLQDTFW